jgi:hypothetical protein
VLPLVRVAPPFDEMQVPQYAAIAVPSFTTGTSTGITAVVSHMSDTAPMVGAPGTTSGTTALDAIESGEPPSAFVA